ncbi:uncharacterized protein [Panulirus ornatus]|uniref:uncharacterized protein n=1 Tax=Panulirus ornatus TaxID=150431 RepID=UPI003A87E73E
MALGHNVMFPGGKLMQSAAHEAHRYMTEAYRLATGEPETYRMPYTAAAVSSPSLTTETHRSTVDISAPSVTGDRSQNAAQRQAQGDRIHYTPVSLPTHMNVESPRLESHSSRVLSALERLPHNANRQSTIKAESEPVLYGKNAYSTAVSDITQLPSQVSKSKNISSVGSSHMFPVPFSPSYQQYSEENGTNYKRHYFDEASTPRREALSDCVSTAGELPQLSRERNDNGSSSLTANFSRFNSDCGSQGVYSHEDLSRNGNRPAGVVNSELNLVSQATTSANSEIIVRSKMPKGRQPKTYKCQICEQEFKNGTQLKNHTWRHTGEKPYSCVICQATFTQQSNLKTHMRIHTGERPYTCEECNATFTQISNLRTHQKIHTGEKPYECDICLTRFSQQSNLKSHKLIHSGERPFKCEVCGASFVQSTHLRNHKRIHTNERPYACDQCGAKFRQLSNLKTHEKIHTGERPHVCEECGSAFAQKSNLKSHKLKLHSNDGAPTRRGRKKKLEAIRPFICEECGAKFTMMSNLKIHMRLHTGEKPFHCTLCGASFAQRSNLKAHEQTHSDERPFKCLECTAAFRQKTNLKTHKMKKHPVKSLKIKILQDSQYIMQDLSQVAGNEGEGSSHLIEEPIVQIREGKSDHLHILTEGALEEEECIKLEREVCSNRESTLSQKNARMVVSEPCPHEANPYDSPNF